MSGNLCRCGAYVNIVAAVSDVAAEPGGVTPPPGRPGEAVRVRPGPRHRGRRRPVPRRGHYLGGGTNLVDLMRLGVAAPDHLVDVTGRRTTGSSRADGGLRIGAGGPQQRPGGPSRWSASATRCWPGPCWPGRLASCATWPRSAGTCCSAPAARTSRTSPSRATSAARVRLPGDSGGETLATSAILGRTRRSASPPTRRTWRWRWPPSTPGSRVAGLDGSRAVRCRGCTGCPRQPTGTPCSTRGADHRGRAAAAAARPVDVPQGARARVVRVRARVARRGARHRRGRAGAGLPARPRRGGARPVARARRRAGLAVRPARRETFARAADAELRDARPLPGNEYKVDAGAQPDRRLACSRRSVLARSGRRAVEGRDKVTGTARYAFEYPVRDAVYALSGAGGDRQRPDRARSTPPARSPCRGCSRCSGQHHAPPVRAGRLSSSPCSRRREVTYRGQLVGCRRRRHTRAARRRRPPSA